MLGLRHQPSPGSSACLSGAHPSSAQNGAVSIQSPERFLGACLSPRFTSMGTCWPLRESSPQLPLGAQLTWSHYPLSAIPSWPNLRLCPFPCLRNLAASTTTWLLPGSFHFLMNTPPRYSPLPGSQQQPCLSSLSSTRPVLSTEGRIDPTRTPAERKGASEERSRWPLTQLQLQPCLTWPRCTFISIYRGLCSPFPGSHFSLSHLVSTLFSR